MCRSHVPVAGLESRCGQLGGLLATAGPRLVVPLVARLRLRRPGWHRRLATWVLLPAAARTTGHPSTAQLSSLASWRPGRGWWPSTCNGRHPPPPPRDQVQVPRPAPLAAALTGLVAGACVGSDWVS